MKVNKKPRSYSCKFKHSLSLSLLFFQNALFPNEMLCARLLREFYSLTVINIMAITMLYVFIGKTQNCFFSLFFFICSSIQSLPLHISFRVWIQNKFRIEVMCNKSLNNLKANESKQLTIFDKYNSVLN